jgi:hypothetical protein
MAVVQAGLGTTSLSPLYIHMYISIFQATAIALADSGQLTQ